MSKCGCGGCTTSMIAKWLLVIGGFNWGLVGLGMLMEADWNVVSMILGAMPVLEAIVYLLVGASAVIKLVGCRCGKCKACENCATCGVAGNSGEGMQ